MIRTSHRTIDNKPTLEVVANLEILCREFLEPIREQFGPVRVNSGYRSPELNKAIGGAKDSAHKYGCAADLDFLREGVTTTEVAKWLRDESGLLFDQTIDEFSSTSNWLHLGILRPEHEKLPRLQVLVFKGGKYSVFKD